MSAALTSQIDIAAIVFTLFWVFFIGLIYYLHREAKREGYPLDSDRSNAVRVEGFPAMPPAKTYLLRGGHEAADGERKVKKPAAEPAPTRPDATPSQGHYGSPLEPNGDPMGVSIGPGSWAERADHPERTLDGRDQIVPMRVGTEFGIEPDDPDPRGFTVVAGDGNAAGTLHDVWCDRAEPQIRYYEVAVDMGEGEAPHHALVPVDFARVKGGDEVVMVPAITAEQFRGVPALSNPDSVTLREEDQISAYYGGGMMYSQPGKMEPLF